MQSLSGRILHGSRQESSQGETLTLKGNATMQCCSMYKMSRFFPGTTPLHPCCSREKNGIFNNIARMTDLIYSTANNKYFHINLKKVFSFPRLKER